VLDCKLIGYLNRKHFDFGFGLEPRGTFLQALLVFKVAFRKTEPVESLVAQLAPDLGSKVTGDAESPLALNAGCRNAQKSLTETFQLCSQLASLGCQGDLLVHVDCLGYSLVGNLSGVEGIIKHLRDLFSIVELPGWLPGFLCWIILFLFLFLRVRVRLNGNLRLLVLLRLPLLHLREQPLIGIPNGNSKLWHLQVTSPRVVTNRIGKELQTGQQLVVPSLVVTQFQCLKDAVRDCVVLALQDREGGVERNICLDHIEVGLAQPAGENLHGSEGSKEVLQASQLDTVGHRKFRVHTLVNPQEGILELEYPIQHGNHRIPSGPHVQWEINYPGTLAAFLADLVYLSLERLQAQGRVSESLKEN